MFIKTQPNPTTPRAFKQAPPGLAPGAEKPPTDGYVGPTKGPNAPEPIEQNDKAPEVHGLSGIKKAILVSTMGLSAVMGMAGTAGAAPLVAAQTVSTELQRAQGKELSVLVLPKDTPRLDVIRMGDNNDYDGGRNYQEDYAPVGIALGGGLFQDVKGNLSVVPFLSFDWNVAATDFQRVDLGTKGQSVQRFGTTVHYSESSTRRDIYTEKANRTELKTKEGLTVFERQQDGSIKVTGPKRNMEYTVRRSGMSYQVERQGQPTITVTNTGDKIRVGSEGRLTGGADLRPDGSMYIKSQEGEATATRSQSGLITEIDGKHGMRDARIVRDGDTFVGLKDRDRMSVDDRRMLDEAKARYNDVIEQLNRVDPGFEQKHPLVASVLEYASANPSLLTHDKNDAGFLQAGTMLGATGATVGTVSALGSQAAALNMANSARALGAAALAAKAAAQAQAAAGNMAAAASLAQDAQTFAGQAHAAKDAAIKTGGKAMKQANFARVMAGVGGALQIVDGVIGYKGGKSDKALVAGAIAVTEARMDELTRQFKGADGVEARQDYDQVMKVMNELDRQADKKVRVGTMKIGLGGLMVVSALLGPAAPPLLGAIGIAGTAGVTIYEHWGPIKGFLTGTNEHVPTFLDILPKEDQVIIHLDGVQSKKHK